MKLKRSFIILLLSLLVVTLVTSLAACKTKHGSENSSSGLVSTDVSGGAADSGSASSVDAEPTYYAVTLTQGEHGEFTADKQEAAAGEKVTLTATPDKYYKILSYSVNGNPIKGNSFNMPERDVEITALFTEIFVKGETFGYSEDYISTSGVNASYDHGEEAYVTINGQEEQYAYYNDVYAEDIYVEAKVNVAGILNGDAYPKFGMQFVTDTDRAAFFVYLDPSLTASVVGSVYTGVGEYVWNTEKSVSVGNLAFTEDDDLTLGLLRRGEKVYFFVGGRLVMYEENCEILSGKKSVANVFAFNTELTLTEYFALTGEDTDDMAALGATELLKLRGETYGISGSYVTSLGVDLSFDRGETPRIEFDGDGSPQYAYLDGVSASKLFYTAKFNVSEVLNDEGYPKFGLFMQTRTTSVFLYIDMKTDLTSSKAGFVYVRNGAWDWNNSRTYKLEDVSFDGEDTVEISVMRNGATFMMLVDGCFVLCEYESELGDNASAFGAFGFNTKMTVSHTATDDSDEKLSETEGLIPRIGRLNNGLVWRPEDFIYDRENDSISILHSELNDDYRAHAALYEKGQAVFAEAFAVSGKVRIYNTRMSGAAASKVEFEVAINITNYLKIQIFRFQNASGTSKNNSLYIMGSNRKGEGNIPSERVKENTYPDGDDITFNYSVIFDHGVIYFVLDDEVQYMYETGWDKAGYSFGVLRYADTLWSDFDVKTGDEVMELAERYRNDYMTFRNSDGLTEDHVLENGNEETLATGTNFRTGALVKADLYSVLGKASVRVENDTENVEYRLYRTLEGYWTTERRIVGEVYSILYSILPPQNDTYGRMNFEIAATKNELYFLLNGRIYDSLNGNFENVTVTVSVTGGSAYIHNAYGNTFATDEDAASYIASCSVRAYISGYSTRINSLYDEYVASGESKTGGVLLFGSSTMDFWDNWAEDLGLTDKITGYNVGIGGTTTYDWLSAYDKLVKPFDPSLVLIFVGGNDINGLDARGIDVAARLIQIF